MISRFLHERGVVRAQLDAKKQMRFHMLERGHLSKGRSRHAVQSVQATKHLACFQAAFQSVAIWFKLSRQRIPVAGPNGLHDVRWTLASA
eukprot:symbB.v1.2.029753.t1/scaffold3293.1/size59574/2